MKNRKQARRIRRARKQAERIVIGAARQDTPVRSVEDLICTVERITGTAISVVTAPLGGDTFGQSVLNLTTGRCEITISEACGTWEHTLAHELGHIALQHDQCGADSLTAPAPFEGLAEMMTGGVEARQRAEQCEQEAEAFADEVLRLLEYTARGADASTLPWAASLTA